MTEAGWTREKPSKEGVYWFRWGKDRDAIIVLVLIEYGDWRVMEMGHQHSGALAGYVTGEFFGPITPDSFQQGRVASCEWKYDDMDDYYETACKNAYCLADGTLKDNEHKYCPYCGGLIQLAQQAQDKKGVGE